MNEKVPNLNVWIVTPYLTDFTDPFIDRTRVPNEIAEKAERAFRKQFRLLEGALYSGDNEVFDTIALKVLQISQMLFQSQETTAGYKVHDFLIGRIQPKV